MASRPQDDMEGLLVLWGRYARRMSDMLGYPRTSCIATIAETVKTADRKERRNQKPDSELTAKGRQKISRKPLDQQILPDDYMAIDAIVAKSPNHMQKVLMRAYLWGQPDRIAAREMRIDRERFTERREAAVKWVATKFFAKSV